jgi:hypothetical protein
MTNQPAELEPGIYRSITVETEHDMHVFTGRPILGRLFTGTYFVSVESDAEPSGLAVVWQQRIDHGVAEGVTITAEPFAA